MDRIGSKLLNERHGTDFLVTYRIIYYSEHFIGRTNSSGMN